MSNQLSNEQLLETYSSEYIPLASAPWTPFSSQRPTFTLGNVKDMLPDPRIQYGLWLIKGPIGSARPVCKVKCKDLRVQTFLRTNIARFWTVAVNRALRAIEWGYSPHEIIYRQGHDGLIHFHNLRDFYPTDVELFSLAGKFCGFRIKHKTGKVPEYLGTPKAFLHVHGREHNPYYGRSRLYSAYVPWWEKWGLGGYRDIRRLWYFKCSYDGGAIFYPPGSTKDDMGAPISNRKLAQEIIEKKRAGGTLAMPASVADSGAPAWSYQPPEANASPTGLLEYGDKLDDEQLEAMGIPPEIISSGGDQGFGSSTGRQIPQTAFYSTLQELMQWLLYDLDEQILQFLVRWNFGRSTEYEIEPFLLDPDANKDGGEGEYNGNQFQDENLDASNPAGQSKTDNSSANPPPFPKAA